MLEEKEPALQQTRRSYDRIAAAYERRWRHRDFLLPQFQAFVALVPAQGPVIDVGCGPGFDSAVLRRHGLDVVGIDLSESMLEQARQRYPGPYVQADMCALPLTPPLAGIWANASLLHLPHQLAAVALRDFARLLCPGGPLFVSVKAGCGAAWDDGTWGPANRRFFAYWDDCSLDQALLSAGFALVSSERQAGSNADWITRLARRDHC